MKKKTNKYPQHLVAWGILSLANPRQIRYLGLVIAYKNEILGLFRYPGKETNTALAKLLWLVRLRWLAIALFFCATVPAIRLGFLDRSNLATYIGIVAVLFTFNLLTQLFWSERIISVRSSFIGLQLSFDLLILTGILFLTGGWENPFLLLFFLHAVLGGLLLSDSFAWFFLVLLHTLLLSLQLPYFLKIYSIDSVFSLTITMLAYHFLLLGFWLVTRSLGQYLEKQREQQIQAHMLLEKQDRLRALGALSAGFSHEFSSPLNAAKIRLHRLQRTALNEKQKEEVDAAINAIFSCEEVVKQINSSQMDARDFHKKKVPLRELLLDIIESWKEDHSTAHFNGLTLALEDVGDVEIAPINFAQVILNLLDNAFEASPQSPICISLKQKKNKIHIDVTDQGPGFSPTILHNLGEPFNTNKAEGTGLGLYVSQLFAESLGGSLQISNNTKGATVCLQWPVRELS